MKIIFLKANRSNSLRDHIYVVKYSYLMNVITWLLTRWQGSYRCCMKLGYDRLLIMNLCLLKRLRMMTRRASAAARDPRAGRETYPRRPRRALRAAWRHARSGEDHAANLLRGGEAPAVDVHGRKGSGQDYGPVGRGGNSKICLKMDTSNHMCAASWR